MTNLKGDIEFNSVDFNYPQNEDVKVLSNVTFKIPQGQYVGIVGTSGSGKSTIVKLIERFYEKTAGVIKIGGIHIQDMNHKSLRKNIGLVSQSPILFNATIRFNIAYGLSYEPCDDEIYNACKQAGCYSFISDPNVFPQGLETIVGEKGSRLSGGQIQRISIARALITKPKIIIFDEATSALDSESENMINEAINYMVQNIGDITIVVVSHRLSSIVNCQQILVMSNGQLIERGTHKELIEQQGHYAKLISRQLYPTEQIQEISQPQHKQSSSEDIDE